MIHNIGRLSNIKIIYRPNKLEYGMIYSMMSPIQYSEMLSDTLLHRVPGATDLYDRVLMLFKMNLEGCPDNTSVL